MNYLNRINITLAAVLLLTFTAAVAETVLQQWQQGLKGALLTSYSGSVISSNSSLTTIRFCSNGRYSYHIDGSWSVPGVTGGATNNMITGQWEVIESGNSILLKYVTDSGEQGNYPVYLQNNGRVNIGGTAFAVQRGGAGC